jgi:uracil-DNA glycosylase
MSHPAQRPQLDARQTAMLAEMGVNVWWDEGAAVPVTEPVKEGARAVETRPAAPPAPTRPVIPEGTASVAVPLPGRADVSSLDRPALETVIRACAACDLGRLRQQAVPGMGDPSPDWLVIGEAPGEEEDRQGLPFVGRAGQLLDRMLAAMRLTREQQVYITNVIKCRPPHNRNPDPVEIAQCTPFLLRQVELLRPRIILAMGRFAAQTVLAQGGRFDAAALQQMPLGKLRGQVHEVTLGGQTLPVVVTYHPAYLLRSPAEKGKAWADLCLAMETLEQRR